MTQKQSKRILIAEDEEGDITLIKVALQKCGAGDQAEIARDGEEALDYLYCRGNQSGKAEFTPALVLLDLKLPKVTGLEILRQIRSDKRLRFLPVVIFTSSSDDNDRMQCLESGANDYIIKPIGYKEFCNSIQQTVNKYLVFT